MLVDVEPTEIARVATAVGSLLSLGSCRDPEGLPELVGADGEDVRLHYREIQRQVARAAHELESGSPERAIKLAQAAREESSLKQFRSLVIDSSALLRSSLVRSGQDEAADVVGKELYELASASGDWERAMEAAAGLSTSKALQVQAAGEWLYLAEAAEGRLENRTDDADWRLRLARADVTRRRGDTKSALEQYDQLYADSYRVQSSGLQAVLQVRSNAALMNYVAGNPERALKLADESLRTGEESLGEGHPILMPNLHSLATIELGSGRNREALEHFEQILEWASRHPGTARGYVASSWQNLALANRRLGNDHAAIAGYEKAIRAGIDGPEAAINLSVLLTEKERGDEAAEVLEVALAKIQAQGHEDLQLVRVLVALGRTEGMRGNTSVARAYFVQATGVAPPHPGEPAESWLQALVGAGTTALELKDYTVGLKQLEEAYVLSEYDAGLHGWVGMRLAESLWGLPAEYASERARASSLMREAKVALESDGARMNRYLPQVTDWLKANGSSR